MKPRLLAIASHPIQYIVPVYRELTQKGRVDVRVLYCREFGIKPTYDKQFGRQIQWDTELLGGYEHLFLQNLSPIHNTFNPLHAINPGVIPEVLKWADVVWINGLMYPSNWLAIMAAKMKRVPVIFRSELGPAALAGSGLKSGAKRAFYRNALRLMDSVMLLGTQNRRAYDSLGVDDARYSNTPYTVDVSRFQVSEAERLNRRMKQRMAWGIKEHELVALFLGKLTERKHPEALLALDGAQAAARLALVWGGTGEKEKELRERSGGLRHARPIFNGLVNQTEIPDVLWASDLFVMPSEREPWGLVLNEAMAAGLPSIVSEQVGAAADLCVDGETGYVIPAGDEKALIAAVDKLAGEARLRERMGRAALERISRWTPGATAEGIEEAVMAALAQSERRHERPGRAE